MPVRRTIPVVLTVAGSDAGGGAGIQADLKTFAALDVHGTSVITCITAQNPTRVSHLEPCRPGLVRDQLQAIAQGFQIAAAKTGILYSAGIIRTVARFIGRAGMPLVVDPVMVSTSGSSLLQRNALTALQGELFPHATLLTPNIPEAEILLGQDINSVEAGREATRALRRLFGCAVLLKGGHWRGLKLAVDVFYDGDQELLFSSPFIRGVRTHGTGCTYSAAITAYLARGFRLPQAVRNAKEYVTRAIANSRNASGHHVLWR